MKFSEMILEAMDGINEDYIGEYIKLKNSYKGKKIIIKRYLAIAASLSIVIITAIYGFKILNHDSVAVLSDHKLRKPDYSLDFTPQPVMTKEPVIPTIASTVIPSELPTVEPTENINLTESPEITETLIPEITEAPKEQERDWESEWTYFIAHLDSEHGKGVMSHPNDKEDVTYNEESAFNYSDEYFMENSLWTFEFNYQNGKYIARDSQLQTEDIGEYLGDISINIYERRLKALHFNRQVSLYAINNISPEAALAICVDNIEYYLFVNQNYSPNNLKEFLTDFNLMNTTKLTQIAVFDDSNATNSSAVSDELEIWNLLLSDEGNIVDLSVLNSEPRVNVEMDNDFYSYYDIPFSLYDEGYVYFNVLGNKFSFYLGNDVVNQLATGGNIYGKEIN